MKKMRVVAVALAWAGMVAGLGMGAAQTAGQAAANPTHDGETVMNGAPKRPMTFADLMAMKRVSDPQISPSGKWVMFSVTDVSLEKNTKVNHLWVVPLGSSGGTNAGILPSGQNDKQERQVTFGSGESFGRFSPDGKFVSYTGAPTKDDPVSRITIATWDEATGTIGVGRTLTAVSGDADGAIWSPDSRHFLFTTQVYPECSVKGGERANANATTSANAGILRSAQNDNRGGGEIAGAEPATWVEEDACDKAKDEAAVGSPVKAQIWDELLYRHWDAYTGLKRTHIIVADFSLAGANPRDLTPASAVGDAETPTWFLGAPLQYAWAPDSKEIAYVTNLDKVPAASTNNDVFTLRLDEPGAKAVKVSTSPGSDDEPEYSPDGKWLAFRSQKQAGFESDRFRLMLFDREKKTIRELMPRLTTPKGIRYDGWIDEFTWVPDGAAIVFVSGSHGTEAIFSVNVLENQIANPIFVRLTSDGEFADVRTVMAGNPLDVTIVATKTEVTMPNELVSITGLGLGHTMYDLVDIASEKPDVTAIDAPEQQLSHLNGALLTQLDLPIMENFWFAGAEGTKVQGFILRPPGFDPVKKYPVKFVMHGGPQTALGDSWSYRWNWELLAADGYVVVGINRRGSTGYGQKFVDEVSGDWGGRAYEDLMKGLDYAEATYPFIDKTRECALGASYGGFMADWVLTHTNRFQCIVTHDGMVDPVSAYGTTEEMWFNEWEFRRPEDFPKGWDGFPPDAKQTTAGHPAEPWRYQNLPADQDPFRKWSALRSIENAKTPTLVIHSQKDYRLDVSQGFELYTALQRRGVPARFLYFPDEGHWVLKPQNSQLWYQTVDDWCDRWTKTGKYAETK
jgi:dipeptidyl aminopeptidase/acylaminoacyl peptidase